MRIKNFCIKFVIFLSIVKSINNVQYSEWDHHDLYDKPAFQVIFNKLNDEAVVGTRDFIYRLTTENIREIEKAKIRVADSPNCLPPPEKCDKVRKFVHNDNKILLIKYEEQNSAILLACGVAYQGMCRKFNANNFKDNKTLGSPKNVLNFVGSNSSSLAFFVHSYGENVLVVAHSYDGRPFNYSPPLISLRKMDGEKGFSLFPNSNSSSAKLEFKKQYKNEFRINYIYGFSHNNNSYILTTQPISTTDKEKIITKLVRISRTGETSFSYMEIELICNNKFSNSSDYQNSKNETQVLYKASTGYFGKIGSNQYGEFEIDGEKNSHALFVTFVGITKINNTSNSTFCAFGIKMIENAFLDFIENCTRGVKSAKNSDELEKCQNSGRDALYIDNRMLSLNEPLFGLFLHAFEEKITSLAVTIQKANTIAIIGTESGKLMKVLVGRKENNRKIFFEKFVTEVFPYMKKEFKEDPYFKQIRPDPAFDGQEKNLYFLTHYHVIKVPIGTCSLYKDCSSCLQSGDPLGCGWCKYNCSSVRACNDIQIGFPINSQSCMPRIDKFTPVNGSIYGNDIIKIYLSYKNYTKIFNISVTISGIECVVTNFDNSIIDCKTGAVIEETFVPIEVRYKLLDISEGNENYVIYNGTAISEDDFHYSNVTNFDFYISEAKIEKEYLYSNKQSIIIIFITFVILLIIFLLSFTIFIRNMKKNISIQQFNEVRYTNVVDDNVQPTESSVENSPRDGYVDGANILKFSRVIQNSLKFQLKKEFIDSLEEDHILIERNNLVFEYLIGTGEFGCVYKGILFTHENGHEEVAIKTLRKSPILENEDIESFLQEGLLMKEFDDCNVLKLKGICFDEDNSPLVLLPFMNRGDLLSYIRDPKNILIIEDLLLFAVGIAKGMDYLSKQRYVHRDLAARNCLLDSNLCVKISDFGLSRDVYLRDYYKIRNKNCKLPVKWMAPESLGKRIFNTKTDVWSYGILVWELMTRGITPYPHIDLFDVLVDSLKGGYRLPQPNDCPNSIYKILLECWSDSPESRPDFEKIHNQIQQILDNMV